MSMAHEPKQRKPKVRKAATYAARRQADRPKRVRQRNRTAHRQQQQQHFRFRVKVVRTYRAYRHQLSERQAAERTLAQYQPRAAGDFPLTIRTIRAWHRIATQDGFAALRPRSCRPQTIHYRINDRLIGLILTLRQFYGWGGHRIAAELARRALSTVSGATVYTILRRYHVPIQCYALKGRSDGPACQRLPRCTIRSGAPLLQKWARLLEGHSSHVPFCCTSRRTSPR